MLSPATEKRLKDEFKRDVDECTTDSDFMSGPEGKTLSEIHEKIADSARLGSQDEGKSDAGDAQPSYGK